MKTSLFTSALLTALLANTAHSQGKCDHYLDDECLDAYGIASLEFKPLFTEPLKFGYGFRVRFDNESYPSNAPGNYKGDQNHVRAWFQYDRDTLIVNTAANRTTSMLALFVNSSDSVSGQNNGCNGALGEECANNLKDILKWSMVLADDYGQWANLGKFEDTPPTNLSCPKNIFEDFAVLTNGGFVKEYNETDELLLIYDENEPVESGNATEPWYSDWAYRPAEEQMTYTGIGVVARYPPTKPRSYEQIQLELVCVRPEAVEGSGDRIDLSDIPQGSSDSSGSDDGESASSRLHEPSAMVIAAMSLVLMVLWVDVM